MIQLSGFLKGDPQHYKVCDHCKAIIGYDNEDINRLRNNNESEILCPNCESKIKILKIL